MDYTSTSCLECQQEIFQPYTISNCEFWKSSIVGFLITTCGTSVNCIQDQSELESLRDQGKAQYVTGLGTLNDSTANTVDVPFPLGPDSIPEDYTNTVGYEVPFYNKSNYPFWNELKQTGTTGDCFYVLESGIAMKMSSNPSITVDWGANGEFFVVKGDFTYNTTSLDEPFYALGPVFGKDAGTFWNAN